MAKSSAPQKMCLTSHWSCASFGAYLMKKYLLGVDGGNTKTDYVLFSTEGDFVDFLHTGTCSHEAVEGGYDGMEQTMRSHIVALLAKNSLTVEDIAAAGMGLAGADLPLQIEELKKRVAAIGLANFKINNDAILGIKAVLPMGIGLCAVNGTGTSVFGNDENGSTSQVSGMGPMTGDFAGGSYIFTRIMSKLYEFHYRMGENSGMFEEILEFFKCDPNDLPSLIGGRKRLFDNAPHVIQIANRHAKDGDEIAKGIFDSAGEEIGKSAAGCISKLSFKGVGTDENPIGIALAGTIWKKVDYSGMIEKLMYTIAKLCGKKSLPILLNVPPALGGVIWAKEILEGKPVLPGFRKKVEAAIAEVIA